MIEKIYEEWLAMRNKIGKRKSKLTPKRKSILQQLLLLHEAEDILIVLTYLFSGDDHYARFMRGENDNNKDYTTFDSVFRPTKMKDKIAKATKWSDNQVSYSDSTYFPFKLVG